MNEGKQLCCARVCMRARHSCGRPIYWVLTDTCAVCPEKNQASKLWQRFELSLVKISICDYFLGFQTGLDTEVEGLVIQTYQPYQCLSWWWCGSSSESTNLPSASISSYGSSESSTYTTFSKLDQERGNQRPRRQSSWDDDGRWLSLESEPLPCDK